MTDCCSPDVWVSNCSTVIARCAASPKPAGRYLSIGASTSRRPSSVATPATSDTTLLVALHRFHGTLPVSAFLGPLASTASAARP